MSELRQIPIEDVSTREPEFEFLELGYGQGPTLRDFLYDPINDEVLVLGPVIEIDPPERPA